MFRMVIQAVLFSALALGFIVTKSDGLRHASQTGDMSYLASTGGAAGAYGKLSGALAGGATGIASDFKIPGKGYDPYAPQPWYEKYDPRQLFSGKAKTIRVASRLSPETVRVTDAQKAATNDSLADQLAAQSLSNDVVSVVTLK